MLTSTLELVAYYTNLLIMQYANRPRARATIEAQVTPVLLPQVSVQEIDFGGVPASGTFVLSWDEVSSAAINWDDSEATVQTKIRAITGLSTITVSGSPAAGSFAVTFVDVTPPAALFELVSSSLDTGDPTITETDETLPFAIQNAFNLSGDNIAVGVQLDMIAKYTGVTRIGQGFTQPISLDDADFLKLIQLSIFTNSAQSDLATIQDLIATFFPGEMIVYDYQNMHMSYVISTSIGSRDLVEMFVTQGLLPRPMGVQMSVVFAPFIIGWFGFVTYEAPANPNISPFNTYEDYQTDYPWLDYQYSISA